MIFEYFLTAITETKNIINREYEDVNVCFGGGEGMGNLIAA